MGLFPFQHRTLASNLTIDEVRYLLDSVTKSPEEYELLGKKDEIKNLYKFNGVVGESSFRLSKKVSYAQSFLPLVKGEISATKSGTVLFMNFTFFFGSWVILILGSIITLSIGLIFSFVEEDYAIAVGGYFFFLVNYIVAIANFNMHVKDLFLLINDSISFD